VRKGQEERGLVDRARGHDEGKVCTDKALRFPYTVLRTKSQKDYLPWIYSMAHKHNQHDTSSSNITFCVLISASPSIAHFHHSILLSFCKLRTEKKSRVMRECFRLY
jgi:hypothetical protein